MGLLQAAPHHWHWTTAGKPLKAGSWLGLALAPQSSHCVPVSLCVAAPPAVSGQPCPLLQGSRAGGPRELVGREPYCLLLPGLTCHTPPGPPHLGQEWTRVPPSADKLHVQEGPGGRIRLCAFLTASKRARSVTARRTGKFLPFNLRRTGASVARLREAPVTSSTHPTGPQETAVTVPMTGRMAPVLFRMRNSKRCPCITPGISSAVSSFPWHFVYFKTM